VAPLALGVALTACGSSKSDASAVENIGPSAAATIAGLPVPASAHLIRSFQNQAGGVGIDRWWYQGRAGLNLYTSTDASGTVVISLVTASVSSYTADGCN
jgi:hypothetical protein